MSYEFSTQRLRWTFSEDELKEKRVNVFNDVVERFERLQNDRYPTTITMTPATAASKGFESLSILSPPPKRVYNEMKVNENIFASPKPKQPKRDLLSLSIEEHLLHYFSNKIVFICNSIAPKDINRKETINTSIHYFNRFYLKYSIFDYDPKFALLGCISLASKITEDTIKLNDLIEKINLLFPSDISVINSFPKEYTVNNLSLIYMAQLHISEGINFDYYIYSPYSVLRILIEKLKDKNPDNRELKQNANLKCECQKIINNIEIFDNIIFVYSPSDIAISSLKYTLTNLIKIDKVDIDQFVENEINLYPNGSEIKKNIEKLMVIIENNYKIDKLFDENKMKDILNDYYDCTRILLNPVTRRNKIEMLKQEKSVKRKERYMKYKNDENSLLGLNDSYDSKDDDDCDIFPNIKRHRPSLSP